ncbi:MAG: hypothetical protein JKY65_24070 [Planctomycetes bacterium]|nr:hypothetical protein [Planctomycetota bacterium]
MSPAARAASRALSSCLLGEGGGVASGCVASSTFAPWIYKITGYPTLLVIDYQGAVLGKVGLQKKYDPKKWTREVDAMIKARFDRRTGLAKPPPKPGQPVRPKRRSAPELPPAKPSKPKKDAGAANGPSWYVDVDKALEESGRTKRPVLALFTCSDQGAKSNALHAIYASKAFKSWADEALILLELDFPARKRQSPRLKLQNIQLRRDHRVKALPEVLFLGTDGKVLARLGPVKGSAADWVKAAKAALKKSR